MNPFAKLKNIFAPKMYNVSIINRTFGGAGGDSGGEWNQDPTEAMGCSIEQMQQITLKLLWTSVIARGIARQMGVLAINTGARLQSTPMRRVLGLSASEASEKAKEIEDVYNLAAGQNTASADGTINFNELQIMAFWSKFVFNEFFAVVRYDNDVNAVSPVNIQLISPIAVKSPPTSASNARIKNGIEYRGSKVVAFWVETVNDSGSLKFRRVPLVGKKSGRITGIAYRKLEQPGQYRAIPRFAPTAHEFERIQAALKYEIDTMALNAKLAITVEREETVINPDKLRALVESGGDVSSLGGVSTEAGKREINAQHGAQVVTNLEGGEKVKAHETGRPNTNVTLFIREVMTLLGPYMGLSVETVLMLFGKSYSASKGGLDLSWKSIAQELYEFTQHFNQVFLEANLTAGIASGALSLPGWSSPIKRAAWLSCVWYGVPKPSLNPLQEEKAATERVNNYRSTENFESQQANGLDFETIADRREQEIERISEIETMYADLNIDPDVDLVA